MTDDPMDLRGELAANLLGRQTDAERIAFEARLDGSPELREEAALLRPVVAALALVDVADLERADASPAPPPDLADRIVGKVAWERAQLDRQARKEQRGRWLRPVAIAAAFVLLLGVGAVVLSNNDQPDDLQQFAEAPTGVDAEFAVEAQPAGTAITLVVDGLPGDQNYWLWLADESGERHGAGTFTGATEGDPLAFTTSFPLDQAVRIWVTDAQEGGNVVLDSPLA